MWPVQTLTLLLCLTDDEQLFAQQMVQDKALPAIEIVTDTKNDDQDPKTIQLDLS